MTSDKKRIIWTTSMRAMVYAQMLKISKRLGFSVLPPLYKLQHIFQQAQKDCGLHKDLIRKRLSTYERKVLIPKIVKFEQNPSTLHDATVAYKELQQKLKEQYPDDVLIKHQTTIERTTQKTESPSEVLIKYQKSLENIKPVTMSSIYKTIESPPIQFPKPDDVVTVGRIQDLERQIEQLTERIAKLENPKAYTPPQNWWY